VADFLHSPLERAHVAEGARLVEFAGYLMPVQYGGVIAESLAVRQASGMFDVSHMARLRFNGPDTLAFLERVTTNDVAKLGDGRGQYSLLPNATGGLVDDIIVYRDEASAFQMVVNASNHAKDMAWLQSHLGSGVEMADETDATAMIAVQGPKATTVLAGICEDAEALIAAPIFGTLTTKIAGVPCFAARSGYTGEDGFELVCPAERSVELWEALRAAGVAPCGLGARDALRVEAGLPLYGHELGEDLSPIAAGLGWVISKVKPFIGSEIINQVRAEGSDKKLQGVKLGVKRLPQPGMPVTVDGEPIGEVTSGVYSPILECGIGMAYINAEFSPPRSIDLQFRGRSESATLVNKRFLRPVK